MNILPSTKTISPLNQVRGTPVKYAPMIPRNKKIDFANNGSKKPNFL